MAVAKKTAVKSKEVKKTSVKTTSSKDLQKPEIGCHVSIAGGVFNAPKNAADLDCETFQIFTRSPHGGAVSEITDEIATNFRTQMLEYNFKTCVIHAPYFINFGSSTPRIFHGSVNVIRQELERGTKLGAQYVMFHPGSFKDLGEEEGAKQVNAGFQEVLEGYEGTTKMLLEISAGAGAVIGDTFEEIADIIAPIKDHPGFGGICFDTQHAYGSGYDLRDEASVKKTFDLFHKHIGLDLLKMSHVNDSKVDLGSHKDRHEHIGDGQIGKKGFEEILKYFHKKKLAVPLILETQHDKVETDIKILKTLRDKVWK